jgi:Protein of unknown function (DUF3352)
MALKKFILPAIGLTVALVGVGVYWYLKNTPGTTADPIAFAKVMPDETVSAAYISTDAKTWEKLEKFGTPEARQAISKELQKFQADALKDSKIDLSKDLQWAGDIMIGQLPNPQPTQPVSNGKSASPTPEMVVVVGIRDKVEALKFAARMTEGENQPKSVETDYKGIKITSSAKGDAHVALLDQYVILTSSLQSIQAAIDTSKGEPSLAGKTEAQAALTQKLDLPNPIAQFYVFDYQNLATEIAGASKEQVLPPEMRRNLEQVKGMAIGVGIDDTGIRVKGHVNLDPQAQIAQLQPASGAIVRQFPANTFALASSAGVNNGWKYLTERAKTDKASAEMVEQIRQGAKSGGFDIDQDLFNWMTGEIALGLIPAETGLLQTTGFGGALLLDSSDRPATERLFTKLDQLVQAQQVSVKPRQVGNQKITDWQTPYGSLVSHGWIDEDTVFIAMDSGLAESLLQKSDGMLDSSEPFKVATSSLPKQNSGYFYLDVEKTFTLMKRAQLVSTQTGTPAEAIAMMDSVRSVAGTSSMPNSSEAKFEAVIALKRAAQ